MLAAANEDTVAIDPRTGMMAVRIDHIDHHPDDPGTMTWTVGIDINKRRHPDGLGTGLTSATTEPRGCQAGREPGTG